MSKRTVFWLSWVVALAAMICLGASGAQTAGHITVVEVRGAISPATADFIVDGIEKSESEGAQLLIIELDTPGGLDPSMRAIIQRMLASRVPIAVYVAPSGARAASAGTFILYASHIAAMTPASNLGAASPVSIGAGMPGSGERKGPARAPDTNEGERPGAANKGAAPEPSSHDTMAAKAMNDAAAYIRSLAELRKRNPAFAEAAVREARSMSAAEALDAGVIDYIAPDLPALLRQVDGKQVQLGGGRAVTLSTQHARVERLSPDWRVQVLALIANPQVAVILMMLGIYGLFFEMMSPGAALPGVAGLICLLLGLYGLNMLPVNWAGVALLAVGLLMMVGEVFLPSFGALGVGGLLAFVLGGLLMTGPDVPSYYELSIPFLLSLALASALIIIGAGTVALRSRRNKLVSGHESMIGATGHIVGVGSGMVYAEIRGENWRVVCDEPLQTGDQIRVVGTDSLKLRVVRAAGAGHPSTPSVPA